MMTESNTQTAQRPAWQTHDYLDDPVIEELRRKFGPDAFTVQPTRTGDAGRLGEA